MPIKNKIFAARPFAEAINTGQIVFYAAALARMLKGESGPAVDFTPNLSVTTDDREEER